MRRLVIVILAGLLILPLFASPAEHPAQSGESQAAAKEGGGLSRCASSVRWMLS